MTWDSFMPSPATCRSWPYKVDDVWEFPILDVCSPPRRTQTDYHLWYSINGVKDAPSSASRVRRIVSETYRYVYGQAKNGNAFNHAKTDFMRDVRGDHGKVCATYPDVVACIELQDPDRPAARQLLQPETAGSSQ